MKVPGPRDVAIAIEIVGSATRYLFDASLPRCVPPVEHRRVPRVSDELFPCFPPLCAAVEHSSSGLDPMDAGPVGFFVVDAEVHIRVAGWSGVHGHARPACSFEGPHRGGFPRRIQDLR